MGEFLSLSSEIEMQRSCVRFGAEALLGFSLVKAKRDGWVCMREKDKREMAF